MNTRIRITLIGVLIVSVAALFLTIAQDDQLAYGDLERMFQKGNAVSLRSAMDDELIPVHLRKVAARFVVFLDESGDSDIESELVNKRDGAGTEASSDVYKYAIDVLNLNHTDTNSEDLFSKLSALALDEYEPGYYRLTETGKYPAIELDTRVDAIVKSTSGGVSSGRRFSAPTFRPALRLTGVTFDTSLSGLTKQEKDAIYANVRHVGLVATELVRVADYSPCVGAGYQKYAYLYLIDLNSRQILTASRLEGGMPPLEVSYGAGEPCDHAGDVPDYSAYFTID